MCCDLFHNFNANYLKDQILILDAVKDYLFPDTGPKFPFMNWELYLLIVILTDNIN